MVKRRNLVSIGRVYPDPTPPATPTLPTLPIHRPHRPHVAGDDFLLVLRKAPIYISVAIGWLNGTGNFCAMIGQPHTRGETQSLIMIAGIPAVLALSW